MVSAISFMSVSPVFAATAVDSDVIKENISVDNENWTQGMVEEQWTETHSSPLFPALYLSIGKHVRYPAEGGKWTYGFWNAKVHSEYKVNKKHGSTVVYIDRKGKSTNSGQLIQLLTRHPLPKFGQLICQRLLTDTITE
ncbi:lactococcin 972 family bacteriocin [Lactobacillus delbrueckii]|uniref:lactococcin 972 family bacteriocin n=2 Tax=Lactobacillus delbrueckii TaxID=1584 RepID=UPI0018C8A7B6|nr:lactococcin 972 family bacteriocin [Lactobacillus delbrueckii]